MKIYLAPLEGVTGYIVRNAFFHHFSGIDQYYTPFIPAGKRMNKKILRDIAPENNTGIKLIPQLMSNRADEVIGMAHALREYGYDSVNINLGCPSGTVVGKKRGSGLLFYPDELDAFLDELYRTADMKISIKTRIGFDSPEEWPRILEIYRRYPIDELIIHPRIQKDFYKHPVRTDAFALAEEVLSGTGIRLCYNGDITDGESYRAILARFPALESVMIGRGLLARPYLAEVIKEQISKENIGTQIGVENGISTGNREKTASRELKFRIRAFHDEIFDGYCSIFSGEKDAMFHMKEIWHYLGNSFSGSEKYIKKIKKAQSFAEYRVVVDAIFRELDINAIGKIPLTP